LKTAHHHWFEHFSVIVCGDDPRVARLKPAPDVFLVTARELGAQPETCLVFEDSLAGVSAARAAGMQVVALPDPAMDKSRYSEADLVIGGYAELTLAEIGI
jgi:pseudouridine-5'-monophosphatase